MKIFLFFALFLSVAISAEFSFPVKSLKSSPNPSIFFGISENHDFFLYNIYKKTIIYNFKPTDEKILDVFPIKAQNRVFLITEHHIHILNYELDILESSMYEKGVIFPIDMKEVIDHYYYLLEENGVLLKKIDVYGKIKEIEIFKGFREESIKSYKKMIFNEKTQKFYIITENNFISIKNFDDFSIEVQEIPYNIRFIDTNLVFYDDKSVIYIEDLENNMKNEVFLPAFINGKELIAIYSLIEKNCFLLQFRERSGSKDLIYIYDSENREFFPIETEISLIISIISQNETIYIFDKKRIETNEIEEFYENHNFFRFFKNSQNLKKFVTFNEENQIIGLSKENSIKIWDFNSQTAPIEIISFSSIKESIMEVIPLKNQSFLAITEKTAYFMEKKGKLIKKHDFSKKILSFSYFDNLKIGVYLDFLRTSIEFYDFSHEKNIGNFRTFVENTEIIDFLTISYNKMDFVIIWTTECHLIAFIFIENEGFSKLAEFHEHNSSEIYRLLPSINRGIFYVSFENGQIYEIFLGVYKKAFIVKKKMKLEEKIEKTFIFEKQDNFLQFSKANNTIVFLNNKFEWEFDITVSMYNGLEILNDKYILFHDGLTLGVIAKFYHCLKKKHCLCKNDGNLTNYCERTELLEEIAKNKKKSEDFSQIWPYALLIVIFLGIFFVMIITNIKSTERELIKAIKTQ